MADLAPGVSLRVRRGEGYVELSYGVAERWGHTVRLTDARAVRDFLATDHRSLTATPIEHSLEGKATLLLSREDGKVRLGWRSAYREMHDLTEDARTALDAELA